MVLVCCQHHLKCLPRLNMIFLLQILFCHTWTYTLQVYYIMPVKMSHKHINIMYIQTTGKYAMLIMLRHIVKSTHLWAYTFGIIAPTTPIINLFT